MQYSSRAVLAVARGNQDNSFSGSNVLQKLRQAHRCVHWNPFPVDYWTGELHFLLGFTWRNPVTDFSFFFFLNVSNCVRMLEYERIESHIQHV